MSPQPDICMECGHNIAVHNILVGRCNVGLCQCEGFTRTDIDYAGAHEPTRDESGSPSPVPKERT